MKDRIKQKLLSIEEQHQVKILYACESGSRAWGFASSDSDFDVRFIYAMHPDEYLSINIESKRDVIELPIKDNLDINGWDIRKALKLFHKSNPPLLEWLNSPIVYIDDCQSIKSIKGLAKTYYSPTSCRYHYYHMAQNNYRDYLRGDEVWLKKYFYVLRPLMATIWLERELGHVPVEFETLLNVIDNDELRAKIMFLLEEKRIGSDLDYGPKIDIINQFIFNRLYLVSRAEFDELSNKCPINYLNSIFKVAINERW